MDKITVAELATECSVKNQVVLAELKRLGLYVFSPTATIDASFAETIRKKIFSQREAEAAKALEAEKKKEAEAAKKSSSTAEKKKTVKKTTPTAPPPPKKKPAAAPRKARKSPKPAPAAEVKPEEEAPKVSLAPRKGRKHYDREAAELVEVTEVKPEAEAPAAVPEPAEAGAPAEAAEPAPETIPAETGTTAAPAPAPGAKPAEEEAPLEPWFITPKPAPKPAPKAPPPVARAAEPAEGHAAGGLKKIVVPKTKTKILMRTSAEKTVTPEAPGRILKGLRDQRPAPSRPGAPTRLIRRRRPERPAAPERTAKVVDLPRPPANPEDYKPMTITEGVTIKELAEKMDIKSKYIIQKLISKGILASINQALDVEAAREVCAEFGFRADLISFEQEAVARQEIPDSPEDYVTRPPVVTIMGHVDHGKTSLLDVIRATTCRPEAGGITQHIGAYQVEIKERSIVFLDTPGHEAFTMMRSRGAQATDIVVLVVAADDGVMPQTIEAIHHSRAAGVPLIVAINKIDKPGAQIDRVKQALADQGLLAEDWGGDVVTVPVSAKQKTNIDLLLEMILLVADMRDLKANPKRLASGVVLEAKVDKGRGCVATVLVQSGTLRRGATVGAGAGPGRVRALGNARGRHLDSAGPSIPVEIQGLQEVPMAGDLIQVFEDSAKARQVVEYRKAKDREQSLQKSARLSLQALYEQMREGTVKELPLILKADVQGSVEVACEMLNKLGTEKAKVKILHSGAGAVTETDVLLASASNAIVIGFNVAPSASRRNWPTPRGWRSGSTP
jgi:translation initiation factor IF-2